MTGIHKHKCSLCGTVFQHGHESFEDFAAHICPACGYLELMVYKHGDPPMSQSETRKAAANFLRGLNDPDGSVRAAAAFSLGWLAVEPQRAVPVLAERASRDPHAAVRRAAVAGLGRFGAESCTAASALALPALTAALKDQDQFVRGQALRVISGFGKAALGKEIEYEAGAVAGTFTGELCRCVGHRYQVQTVALSPDRRYALSGSGQPPDGSLTDPDYSVRLWDLEAESQVGCFLGHTDQVASVVFSPDGRRCLSGSHDATVRLWDFETGQCLRCLEGHTDRVKRVTISADGHHALSGGCDQTLRLWDLDNGQQIRCFPKQKHMIMDVVFSQDGSRGLSGSLDGTVQLWNLASRGTLWPWTTRHHVASVDVTPNLVRMAFDSNGNYVLCASRNKTLALWDVHTGREMRCFHRDAPSVTSIAVASDGRRILSGGQDGTLRLWDVQTGQELACYEGHQAEVLAVTISPDGLFALSGGADRTVRLWELPEAELPRMSGSSFVMVPGN
ncbi:MAG TPA: HEAT repeat domain-containing protein [Gemmataceae bacterium]|nr:HEAT repeat domain-containing protein [Gemmataceae bacterium]